MMKKFTECPEINRIITELTEGMKAIFADRLVGIYLFGSLTYGDFKPERSDIDFMTVIQNPATLAEIKQTNELHKKIEAAYPKWQNKIENSLTPVSMLQNILPPKDPRPYYGEGVMYEAAPYGNEWIINMYLTREYGITLFGKSFKELVPSIDIREVQKASKRDLFQEWEPKLKDPEYLANDHNRSYVVLNLCRILHTVLNAKVSSKKTAAKWVKSKYPEWTELIERAEGWKYGDKMEMLEESREFIKFAVGEN